MLHVSIEIRGQHSPEAGYLGDNRRQNGIVLRGMVIFRYATMEPNLPAEENKVFTPFGREVVTP